MPWAFPNGHSGMKAQIIVQGYIHEFLCLFFAGGESRLAKKTKSSVRQLAQVNVS